MNTASVIVLCVVLLLVSLAAFFAVRRRKRRECSGPGASGCGSCPEACPFRGRAAVLSFLFLSLSATDVPASTPRDVLVQTQSALIDIAKEISFLRNYEAQIPKLEVMSENCPEDDAVWYYLGLCQMYGKQTGKAEASFLEACRLAPDNNEYREKLAVLYGTTGRSDKMAQVYLELLDRNPSKYRNAYTLTLLGDQAMVARNDSLAMEHYDTALLYDPMYPAAQLGKAELYRMSGNMPDFFIALNTFASNPEIMPEAKCSYLENITKMVNANIYKTWHLQLDAAVQACADTHPSDSSALKLAGSWFYSTGQVEKGRKYFDDLLSCYPTDLEANYIRLQLLSIDGNVEGELEQCRHILTLPDLPEEETVRALGILGDLHYKLGDEKSAFEVYDKALNLNPSYVPVLNNYAYFLCLKRKSLRKALKMSKKAIEIEPDNATYLDTCGWILHLLGRDKEAEPHFKRAVLYGGMENAELLSHYAAVLDKLGQTSRASYYRSLAEKKK